MFVLFLTALSLNFSSLSLLRLLYSSFFARFEIYVMT